MVNIQILVPNDVLALIVFLVNLKFLNFTINDFF